MEEIKETAVEQKCQQDDHRVHLVRCVDIRLGQSGQVLVSCGGSYLYTDCVHPADLVSSQGERQDRL